CHNARDSWLATECRSLEEFLPVEAAGSGDVAADHRFVLGSIRQQRLFARSVELRLGEYLETYDDERMKAVESAYRNGDIDRLRMEKHRLKRDLADEPADNADGEGWVRSTLSAATRDIAAETRALRMLHPPDMRTPAQKRKDVEGLAAGGPSAIAAAA
ncbi:unnamed protein product, partial [Ectocarpus sp. 12 AP-2014]